MVPVNCIVEGRWHTVPPMGFFILKEALCKSKIASIWKCKKWFNSCTIMSLGATKVNGWLQGDTSSMMVLVKHCTNRVKLNDILKW